MQGMDNSDGCGYNRCIVKKPTYSCLIGDCVNTIRPQSMIVTLYGDYIRHAGGSIWIGSLIRLLSYFGLSQQAVRSTVSRMTRRELLCINRIGSRSYYSLP